MVRPAVNATLISALLTAGKFIYVLNEVSSTLSVHTLPSSPGVPSKRLYRHIMLPGEDQGNTEMTGAEIILLPSLSPSGPQLLILTNRYSTSSRGDALALFEVSNDGETVRPARSPHYWGVGKHIRALEADPRGKYICTAGRDAGGVVILERVGDGTELKEVCRLEVPNVVVPIWVS
jgi:6-phosphogluconolactonase (cycloisomerase 2 family)